MLFKIHVIEIGFYGHAEIVTKSNPSAQHYSNKLYC